MFQICPMCLKRCLYNKDAKEETQEYFGKMVTVSFIFHCPDCNIKITKKDSDGKFFYIVQQDKTPL